MFELFPAAMRATIFVHDNQQPSASSRQRTSNEQREQPAASAQWLKELKMSE